MRIGIDLACWANERGYGRYTRNLVRALLAQDQRHTYIGFVDPASAEVGGFPPELRLVTVPLSQPPALAAAADGRRRLTDLWRMSRAVRTAAVDVVFFPSTYTYFPVLDSARPVVVVHDAIAEQLPELVFPSASGRLAWTLKTRLACWQARRVVTVSNAAAQSIQQHLPVAPERVRVIYEAPDPVFKVRDSEADQQHRNRLLDRFDIPRDARRVLYVGGFGPHKNVRTLVEAFAQVVQRGEVATPHLVLVGKTVGEVFHSELEAVRSLVRQRGVQAAVTFTGFVPDKDLVHLYQAADCLVLPSLEEGFGLPAVEAMACGTPVIASRTGAMPELLGRGAGTLIDPRRPEEIAAAIQRVLREPTVGRALRTRGLLRAAELSWDRAAIELRAVFEELDPAVAALDARPRDRGGLKSRV